MIVGATILFGIGNHQAQASEQSNATTQSSKNNASADSEKNNMIETPQLNTTTMMIMHDKNHAIGPRNKR